MDEIKQLAYADIEDARIFAEEAAEPALDAIEDGVYAP